MNSSATTVSDFLDWMRDFSTDSTIFRGQGCDSSPLPRLGRLSNGSEIVEIEERIFDEFCRKSARILPSRVSNDWTRLVVAQHYGLHTRLLDWTTNPLTALWFALSNSTGSKKVPTVFALNPKREWRIDLSRPNEVKPWRDRTDFSVLYPPHLVPRIRAQSGCFTVHPFDGRQFRALTGDEVTAFETCRIEREQAGSMLSELARLGVDSSVLFPGLDGLCQYLNSLYPKQESP
jgi:hypothetical protein